jgi:hypothetical protein
MNLECANQIAKAVLYEGYMLYPYRPSSVKNQQRWNFGVVYPEIYAEAEGGLEPASMRTECLVRGNSDSVFDLHLRFLLLQTRTTAGTLVAGAQSLPEGWQEAVERDVCLSTCSLDSLCLEAIHYEFSFPSLTEVQPSEVGGTIIRQQEAIQGMIQVTAAQVRGNIFKVRIDLRNASSMATPAMNREAALVRSLVSTHLVLGVERGEFISLLEPPDDVQDLAAQCQNIGAWPVLVGEQGQRDTLLVSPIILYDYPQIAPESVGDLFDGTEIDEILSLRIMTLTDEEKREIRESDDRARQILDRTEAMPAEQFMKLHGAVRGMRPLREDAS